MNCPFARRRLIHGRRSPAPSILPTIAAAQFVRGGPWRHLPTGRRKHDGGLLAAVREIREPGLRHSVIAIPMKVATNDAPHFMTFIVVMIGAIRQLPCCGRSISIVCSASIVAQPPGALCLRAKRIAEALNRKTPPMRRSASSATQNPLWLRPIKNSGIDSLRAVWSGRDGSRAIWP